MTSWANARHRHDCMYYDGRRPCARSETCDACSEVVVPDAHVLIILLGRLGDVVIATSLLPAISDLCRNVHVTWLTSAEAVPLLRGHPLIQRVHIASAETLYALGHEQFDLVINLDRSYVPATLATYVSARERRGFGVSAHGALVALTPGAEPLFEWNRYRQSRLTNEHSWTEMCHDAAGLPLPVPEPRPSIALSAEERAAAQSFRDTLDSRPLVIICPGSHRNDPHKRLPTSLVSSLAAEMGSCHTAVLMGPEERELYDAYMSPLENAIPVGVQPNARAFVRVMLAADVIVTADSLPLHLADALLKPTVAIFGPTRATVIGERSNIVKLRGPYDCASCHKRTCALVTAPGTAACIADLDPATIAAAAHGLLLARP